MKSIIDFVVEQRPVGKDVLIKVSCPHIYGPKYGYNWEKPTYCNGGRLRNGENVCIKCWDRPTGESVGN